jgi:hypothetical protein
VDRPAIADEMGEEADAVPQVILDIRDGHAAVAEEGLRRDRVVDVELQSLQRAGLGVYVSGGERN